jgi:glucose/arabinose dehydrogenase
MKSLLLGFFVALAAMTCNGSETPAHPPDTAPSVQATPPVATVSTPPTVNVPLPPIPPEHAPLQTMNVERVFPDVSFERMVDMVFSDDGTDRAFLVLQPGQIKVLDSTGEDAQSQDFLDIRNRVSDRGNEEGLLGLTLAPDFSDNEFFYVYYSASNPRRSVISRFSVSSDDPNRADPDSEFVVLEVGQPFSNHNGGQIRFGPDGFLYISLGDGGSRGDPSGNGQNLGTLLGSILRIDVSTLDSLGHYSIPSDNPFVDDSNARGEIWAYGLRNPWRFSFDQLTGDLWVGDVGQNRFEESDLINAGGNYGWNTMEGIHCYAAPEGECDESGLELPVAEYALGDECSVTGGYVYRGSRLPQLSGSYVYGDFCSGKIWALRHDGSRVTEQMQIADTSLRISSFAQSPSGEVFILSFDEKIYRFVR